MTINERYRACERYREWLDRDRVHDINRALDEAIMWNYRIDDSPGTRDYWTSLAQARTPFFMDWEPACPDCGDDADPACPTCPKEDDHAR
jgi:hypothetical protein